MSRWTAPMQALVGGMSRGARRDIENSSPVPLGSRTRVAPGFGYNAAGGMFEYLSAYLTDPVIRPIVARLFQAVSELQWHLYTKSRTGNDQDRTEVTSHAFLDLFNRPNDFQTMPEIIARGQQHWELVGETSIVLGMQKGVKYPLDMWVLRPDRITPIPDPYQFLAGWIYTAPGDGEKIPLETRELLRMVDPSPVDPYRGAGAVQSLVRDLDAQRFTKEWQANFFQNSAQPGGMIIADHRMDDAEFEETAARWAEQHQGVSKAHRVAILENMTWQQNSFSLKDLQLAELDGLSRDKTLAAFGMPKGMIGIVEDVNRANAEAGEYLFARWMTAPRGNNWKAMFNQQLLPLFDPAGKLELDFDNPVPENSEANVAELKTKTDVLVELVGEGFDVDDVLQFIDWPELGYTKPDEPPPTSFAPPVPKPAPGKGGDPKLPPEKANVAMAMRWVATGHKDHNCCDPCEKNIGTLYRSRTAAYADYPLNEGYIKCVGKQYGNNCRCKVVKRRSQRDE